MPTRFVMIGGFLGAGKTTSIARLARHYMSRGQSVGVVTNDQASDLVDTQTLRAQGLDVGEVPGACFCCRFDDLMETIQSLEADRAPDVILAEPVGSCTDLVATVLQPLKRMYGTKFEIAPYAVILKPSHGRRILRNERRAGFSPKAAYILRKQLEEADVVLVNRIDELRPDEVEELVSLVREQCGDVPVLRISARTGEGFAALTELLDQRGDFGRKILDIDYDTYAAGEAELGWLNASVRMTAQQPFKLDDVLMALVRSLADSLDAADVETAHLKLIGLADGYYAVANLVARSESPQLSLASSCSTPEADLVINARVACDPALLADLVQRALAEISAVHGADVKVRNSQSFRPGRPVPTHRFATPEPQAGP